MEEWLAHYRPDNAAAVCRAALLASEHGAFAVWCALVCERMDSVQMEPLMMYCELRALIAALWSETRDAIPAVRPLCALFWALERPLGDELGADGFARMEPNLDAAEHERRIALLDRGKAVFLRHMRSAFETTLRDVGVRNLCLKWARLEYECVHGFQAPARTTPQQAMRDAMGQSDHFAEHMMALLTAVDGKPPELVE